MTTLLRSRLALAYLRNVAKSVDKPTGNSEKENAGGGQVTLTFTPAMLRAIHARAAEMMLDRMNFLRWVLSRRLPFVPEPKPVDESADLRVTMKLSPSMNASLELAADKLHLDKADIARMIILNEVGFEHSMGKFLDRLLK